MIQPGKRIGVAGGGQLGRFLLMEARRAGYGTVVFTDEPPGSPAGQVADREINAAYSERAAVEEFAGLVEVVTYEFENIPGEFFAALEGRVPVLPGPGAIAICQHREREKLFLREHGIPCAPFEVVEREADLAEAVGRTGTPAVLKTALFGYDGKGQVRFDAPGEAAEAWRTLAAPRAVLEGWVDFACELSVVAVRGRDGSFAAFPVMENVHRNHILDTTIMPARIDPRVAGGAVDLARAVAEALGYVGTLAVELFLRGDGTLLVNEVAPRPHNSGHVTMDACAVSQFGQQLRAVTGRPLADSRGHTPGVMVNLLGDVWPAGGSEPDWSPVLEAPEARLHLYGKKKARAGRKMGHFTVLGDSPAQALATARSIKDQLDAAARV